MRSFKFFICLLLIFSLTFFTFSSCLASESTYIWSDSFDTDTSEVSANAVQDTTTTNSAGSSNVTSTENSIQESINTSTSNENSTNPLNLESESAILIEQTTGKVLYAHNEHEQLRPASVTKIMSILLIMEALDSGQISLADSVPCSENAASMGGSQIWLDPKETLTVDEMLKAICVASANDRSCCNGRIYCRF